MASRLGIAILLMTLSSCVSVKIADEKVTKSERVRYESPRGSFEEIKNEVADSTYQSEATGSTISYLSECQEAPTMELESLRDSALQPLKELKVLSSKNETYNGRPAISSHVQGKIEGVNADVDIVIFKKHGCVYTLTLISTNGGREKDYKEFEFFKSRFRVR